MIKLAALAAGPNSEPQNFEGWNRFAQSFLNWTKYITSAFIIRPARNALKLVRGKFDNCDS